MASRSRRWAAGLLVVSALAATYWFFFTPAAEPGEDAGKAWLAEFTDLLTSRRLLGARGPAALALFPGLRPWSGDDCVTEWGRKEDLASIVTYQRLELGKLEADACDQAQFGLLSTKIRVSDGVTPGAFAERMTERFGQPDMHHDTGRNGSISYFWTILDGIFVHLEEPLRSGNDEFSVLFVRSYAAPTFVPSAAEGEQWLVKAVALLTSADLPAARGTAAIRLVDARLLPQSADPAKCPTEFMSDLYAKDPIADRTTVSFGEAAVPRCDDARFASLWFTVWRREPVTATVMAMRLAAKLGKPEVRHDVGGNEIVYRWKTNFGTTVEVSESLQASDHIFFARVWR